MKITKQRLKEIILEEVGPVRGTSHANMLQHMYPGQGNLKNFPTGEPPDNSTREPMTTRAPYETLGIKVDIRDGVAYVMSGKTKYKVWFPEGSDRTRIYVQPCDEYAATIDGERVDWDASAPAFVRFDPHLDQFIKELVQVDFENQHIEDENEEVDDES